MVVSELRGEKIDIIPFNEEPARFVAKALSPARVREVLVDDDAKQATVIVPDDQLSLAIGKEGQNARLAARLTGWRVDIRSETEFAKEEAEMPFDEEETSGRCAAILSNGKRCPNAALPGSRYCGLPAHQELANVEGDHVAPVEADAPVEVEAPVEEPVIEEGADEIAAEAEAVDEPEVDPTEEEVTAIGDENDDVLAADEPPTPSGAADSLTPHDNESVTSQTEAPGTDPHPEDEVIAEELGVADAEGEPEGASASEPVEETAEETA
jgi:N utilization substance protein A